MLKNTLVFIGIVLFSVVLIAPFSFMKPLEVPQTVVKKTKPTSLANYSQALPEEMEDALHHVQLPNFAAIRDVKEKKRIFFNYLLPSIQRQNKVMMETRQLLLQYNTQLLSGESLSDFQRSNINVLSKRYRIKSGLSDLTTTIGLLKRVDISHRRKHLPAKLSGGQQQRVAIARAIVTNPDLILADEPTGNLDSKNSTQVMELLQQLNQEGATIVMVTHAPEHVIYGTRVIELLDGKVITDHLVKEKLNSTTEKEVISVDSKETDSTAEQTVEVTCG